MNTNYRVSWCFQFVLYCFFPAFRLFARSSFLFFVLIFCFLFVCLLGFCFPGPAFRSQIILATKCRFPTGLHLLYLSFHISLCLFIIWIFVLFCFVFEFRNWFVCSHFLFVLILYFFCYFVCAVTPQVWMMLVFPENTSSSLSMHRFSDWKLIISISFNCIALIPVFQLLTHSLFWTLWFNKVSLSPFDHCLFVCSFVCLLACLLACLLSCLFPPFVLFFWSCVV